MELIEIKTGGVFVIDMMYAGTENMMKTDVYTRVGLGNHCFIHPEMYAKLQKLAPVLVERGLKLKICDAYRPPLAHKLMKKIIPMEGFFAAEPERSQHCHASAIDVTLIDAGTNRELEFPCLVDAYTPEYADQIAKGEWAAFKRHLKKAGYGWTAPQAEKAIANRDMLRRLMEEAGFVALEHEWWHYNLPDKEKYPLIDFAISPEGKFIFTPRA